MGDGLPDFWTTLWHTGYYSNKADKAFRALFSWFDTSVNDTHVLALWPIGDGNTIIRTPLGEVCIYFNQQMRMREKFAIFDSSSLMYAGWAARVYAGCLKVLISRAYTVKHIFSEMTGKLLPCAEKLLLFELAKAEGKQPEEDDEIRALKGSPISDPFKVAYLECIYKEIMEKSNGGKRHYVDVIKPLKTEARRIFAESESKRRWREGCIMLKQL